MLTLEILAVLALLLALMGYAMLRTQLQSRKSAGFSDTGRGARILIVDDDPDFVLITKRILESHGYDALTVSSGTDALKVLYHTRGTKPDLVLLDIMMDYVTDGLDVRRMMQQHPDLRDIPVVMITSLTGVKAEKMLPSDEYAHAREWLTKPVTAPELLTTVGRALATSPAHVRAAVPVAS